jgi:uncharacterized cupredoxin-like copper-binding protein
MRKTRLIGAVLVLLAAVSCGAQKGIHTTLDEYSIDLTHASEPAGPQTFSVTNEGEIAHQFLVLRTNDPADDLPVAKNGVVKVEAKGVVQVAEIELLTPGESRELDVDLRPGRYALICNIAGHYASGMRTGFRVR